MFNVVLFGPPGCGKGTQSEKLIQRYGLHHISTGDLLRDEVSRATPLGVEARKFMDNGMLVPDEVVIGMISSRLEDTPDAQGFIFDGFPRTVAQAGALDRLLEFRQAPIRLVLALEVPEDELVRRLVERGKMSGRTDDTEEVISKRTKEYYAKTEPVAQYYEVQGKLQRIKGDESIDSIGTTLGKEVEKFIDPVAGTARY
ncbi:MAG: adenylate kinase [Sphingobacteriales bacterium]|nr:MAG: adenylate kinase [Sphingobacteriales bacterium]